MYPFTRTVGTALLTAAILVIAPVAASADNVFIGLSNTNGSFSTQNTGTGGTGGSPFFGVPAFQVAYSGLATPALSLPSITNTTGDLEVAVVGTIYIAITVTDNTTPLSAIQSSFNASNFAGSGVTITETTFFDPGNGIYAETTPLGSATFSGAGAVTSVSTGLTTGSDYSVTALYKFQSTEPPEWQMLRFQ